MKPFTKKDDTIEKPNAKRMNAEIVAFNLIQVKKRLTKCGY